MKRLAALLILLAAPALADPEPKVFLEDMTWQEVRQKVDEGETVAIIPTGGTEQNGPHLAVGKHNFIVRFAAGEVARALGNAVVAPVLAYVPEGRIAPPEGHMRFPGTISVSDNVFAAVLEDAVKSLRQHGFTLICFLGDHGGSQEQQDIVADRLNGKWRGQGVRVVNLDEYYKTGNETGWLKSRGVDNVTPAAHAGFLDTSELMAVRPEAVRSSRIGAHTEADFSTAGTAGDATGASASHGRASIARKVDAAVKQIRRETAAPRP